MHSHLIPASSPSAVARVVQYEQAAESKLIMVIDDSLTVRKILIACLGRAGFTVVDFVDGVEAMHWLSQPGARIPDLVLLDVGLPRLDGYDVAHRLKSRPAFTHTVIVMLSRHNGILDRLKGRLAGAKVYLTKPFKTQELVEVVVSVLNGLH